MKLKSPKFLLIALCLSIVGCASFTAFRKASAPYVTAAAPIAADIVDAYAASQGGAALTPVVNDLFGMAAVAWAGQPASTGADNASTVATVAPLIAGGSSNVQATALTLAAQQLLTKIPGAPTSAKRHGPMKVIAAWHSH